MIKPRRKMQEKLGLNEPWRYFLETGDYCLKSKFAEISPSDHFHIFQLGNPSGSYREKLRKIWLEHRADILQTWKRQGKRGKPWAEKVFTGEGR